MVDPIWRRARGALGLTRPAVRGDSTEVAADGVEPDRPLQTNESGGNEKYLAPIAVLVHPSASAAPHRWRWQRSQGTRGGGRAVPSAPRRSQDGPDRPELSPRPAKCSTPAQARYAVNRSTTSRARAEARSWPFSRAGSSRRPQRSAMPANHASRSAHESDPRSHPRLAWPETALVDTMPGRRLAANGLAPDRSVLRQKPPLSDHWGAEPGLDRTAARRLPSSPAECVSRMTTHAVRSK